ncbi:hypothetical protein [Marinobacterium sp. MBR-109]|jgi:hypothetical protein|uniref:hypothetical protein n=1 Tax=Marinobacterium sp. MBR-109 TaxID=3156462 RepID=UPI003396041D
MDIASISSALGSIKTATEIAKLIKNSDLSLQDAELKLKLADLVSSLADAKMEIAEIQTELIKKQEEISELESRLKLKEQVNWEEPYYWLGAASNKNGPYCQKCFDGDHKLIRLQGNGEGYWECKVCKSTYTDSSYDSGAFIQMSSGRWDDY